MKKSLLFGVLAFFAVNAVSIQGVDAQNPVKKKEKTTQQVEKQSSKTVDQDNTCKKSQQPASDCCAKPCNKQCKPTPNADSKQSTTEKPQVKSSTANEAKPNSKVKPDPKKETKTEQPTNSQQEM